MVNNRAAWFAWGLYGVVIAGTVYGLVLWSNDSEQGTDFFGVVNALLSNLFPVVFGLVGALILSRLARNRIGWLLMVIALAMAVLGPLQVYYTQTANSAAELTTAQILAMWTSGWGWWLLIGPLLLILLIFPTGRLLSPRWRWVVGLMLLLFVIFVGVITFTAEWQDATTGITFPNPTGIVLLPKDFKFEAIQTPWFIALVSTVALCVLAVVLRYRRAGSVEREQLKWFLYACSVFIVLYASAAFVFVGANPPSWHAVLFDISIMLIPISIGIAILRYRLFDIDIIIRRTLTYGLVTALLGFVFFGSIILLQQIFAGITGSGQNEIVTVLSTLAIAALFVPLRKWVQTAIDRRFNRKKYDAQKVLADFANTVRDETDLEKLTARLMQVVDETMEPRSVSLWLKADDRRRTARDDG
ncbi:MAG: hypothetical protein IT331_05210 [Anaerolineae bacterium]|nr:hypothetical protein [Anaerolineae bacterium]